MIPASDDFITAMKKPIKQLFIKLVVYDSNMKYIKEITKKVTKNDIGSISVDANRAIRRSFSFSLNNIKNEFDWGEDKLIWINKRIKLYTGLKLANGSVEYIPQGVFVLTDPNDSHNFNGKKTNITGQDKSYLLTDKRGKFINETTIETGTDIATAIRIIAEGVGETMFNFDNVSETTPYELTYQSGDNRWKAIKELADLGKCDVYYDVNGYLRLRKIDLNEFEKEPVQWTYEYGSPSEKFYAGNVRSFDETNLANHIRVLGGSGQTATVIYDLVVDENDPNWEGSPYSIQKIGDILYQHNNGRPDPLITSAEGDAKWRAKYELRKRLGFAERVSMQIAPNYLHDGNDVVEVIDGENSVNGKHLLQSFELPINPTLMNCQCLKHRSVIEDWDFI